MDDLISRQDIYDLLDNWDEPMISKRAFRCDVEDLPSAQSDCTDCIWDVCNYNKAISAQPERKKGRWNGYNADNPEWLRDDGSPIFLTCSECNGTVVNNGSAHWNFCPNCGADMRGEENETD